MSNNTPAEIVLASLEHAGITPVDNQQFANRTADGINAIGILGDYPAGHLCRERLPEQLPKPTTMVAGIKPDAPDFNIKNSGPGMGVG